MVKARRDYLRERISDCDTPAVARTLESGVTAKGLTHEAVFSGVRDILTLVLENGGDANERNCAGETPMMIASRYGRLDLVEALLMAGADPEALSTSGDAVINNAAAWPHIEELLDRAIESRRRSAVKVLRPATGRLARKLSS